MRRMILLGAVLALGCHIRSSGSAGPGGQCHLNADCSGGMICVSGVCAAPVAVAEGGACVVTRDCAAGLYCDARAVCTKGGSGVAGQGCTTDAQCVPPLRCALDGFAGVCAASG